MSAQTATEARVTLPLHEEVDYLIRRALETLREGYQILLVGFDGNPNNHSWQALEPLRSCRKNKPNRGRTAGLVLHSIYGSYEGRGGWKLLPNAEYKPWVSISTVLLICAQAKPLVYWPKHLDSRIKAARSERKALKRAEKKALRHSEVSNKPLTQEEQEALLWRELFEEKRLQDAWKLVHCFASSASIEVATYENERSTIMSRRKPLHPKAEQFAKLFWEKAGCTPTGKVSRYDVSGIAEELEWKTTDNRNHAFVTMGLITPVPPLPVADGKKPYIGFYTAGPLTLKLVSASQPVSSMVGRPTGGPEPGTLEYAEELVSQEPQWREQMTLVNEQEKAEIAQITARWTARRRELDMKLSEVSRVRDAIAVIKGTAKPLPLDAEASLSDVSQSTTALNGSGAHVPVPLPLPADVAGVSAESVH